MAYTVNKLAELSGVSIRTLHWYDEIGLLKPAYYGENGYRYYEEAQLLKLQQILFFKELDFDLKTIQKLLGRTDFDKIAALNSHRKVLMRRVEKTHELISTIDETLKHLKGKTKMDENKLFQGFSKEKQAEYENEIVARFGDSGKKHIEEAKQNYKSWKQGDWDKIKVTFNEICEELVVALKSQKKPNSKEVQALISKHFSLLKQFWTPDSESYAAHGKLIVDSELRKAYEHYDPQLPEFIAEAMKIYAKGLKT